MLNLMALAFSIAIFNFIVMYPNLNCNVILIFNRFSKSWML